MLLACFSMEAAISAAQWLRVASITEPHFLGVTLVMKQNVIVSAYCQGVSPKVYVYNPYLGGYPDNIYLNNSSVVLRDLSP